MIQELTEDVIAEAMARSEHGDQPPDPRACGGLGGSAR
jgi:hypothetical protein